MCILNVLGNNSTGRKNDSFNNSGEKNEKQFCISEWGKIWGIN